MTAFPDALDILRDELLDHVSEQADADPMGAVAALFTAGFCLLSVAVGLSTLLAQ